MDEFVDEIEESFAQLVEENQNLKKQVEALRSTADGVTPPTSAPAPIKPAAPTAQPVAKPVASETIVVTTAKEASTAVVRLVEMSTEQAERLLAEATEDAKRIREEATSNAEQVTTDARTQAERLETEARANADKLQALTLSRSEQLDREIDERRAELLDHMQSQRDELSSSVRDLRAFEAAYRSNLAEHLRTQISTLESGSAEPTPVPDLALPKGSADQDGADAPGDGSTAKPEAASETPRLDALLGDQR